MALNIDVQLRPEKKKIRQKKALNKPAGGSILEKQINFDNKKEKKETAVYQHLRP